MDSNFGAQKRRMRLPDHLHVDSFHSVQFADCIIFNHFSTGFKMPLSCRFYSQKFPEVEDVVMVNVRSIAEMGAYVSLLEYNGIEGQNCNDFD